jgi:hypothetical protein
MAEVTTVARTGAEADRTQILAQVAKTTVEVGLYDARGLLVLLGYLVLCSLFGRVLFGHLSTFCIGTGPDPRLMTWFLVWWPHALVHGLNPFLTKAMWTPQGINLAWQTSMPLVALGGQSNN